MAKAAELFHFLNLAFSERHITTMEVFGLSLAVVAAVCTLATSIITRVSSFKKAPKRLAAITAYVNRILRNADGIHGVANQHGSSFPRDIFPLFHFAMCNVRENVLPGSRGKSRKVGNSLNKLLIVHKRFLLAICLSIK